MRHPSLATLFAGVVATAALVAACGASSAQQEGPRDVKQVHRSKCGSCHVRVEPKTRTRAQLEKAFERHRDKRVRLTDEEWRRMIDYLASDAPPPQQ